MFISYLLWRKTVKCRDGRYKSRWSGKEHSYIFIIIFTACFSLLSRQFISFSLIVMYLFYVSTTHNFVKDQCSCSHFKLCPRLPYTGFSCMSPWLKQNIRNSVFRKITVLRFRGRGKRRRIRVGEWLERRKGEGILYTGFCGILPCFRYNSINTELGTVITVIRQFNKVKHREGRIRGGREEGSVLVPLGLW